MNTNLTNRNILIIVVLLLGLIGAKRLIPVG